jgi:hypothetical protein
MDTSLLKAHSFSCVWQPYMQAHIEDVEAEKTERAMLNP